MAKGMHAKPLMDYLLNHNAYRPVLETLFNEFGTKVGTLDTWRDSISGNAEQAVLNICVLFCTINSAPPTPESKTMKAECLRIALDRWTYLIQSARHFILDHIS